MWGDIMNDINRITCVDCGKHIVTEEREHVGGKIKVIEGSYENGYYDGEDDLFYCTECAKKNEWIWGDIMENMILEHCRNNLTRFSTMTDVEIYNWMCDNFYTKDYEMVRKCSRIIFDESR